MTEKTPKRNLAADPLTEGLKKLFDDVLQEPVPAEFLELLEKIDDKARAGGAAKPK